MSALEALRALATGAMPKEGGLLPTCRLEWGGGEAYGEEAVVESFRTSPLDLATGNALSTAGALFWTDGKVALVADLYENRIGRLWRIGPGRAPAAERAVAVPFDTDLKQERRDVLWRAEDHPWLAAEHVDRTEALAREIATPGEDDHRCRCFVLRAFSEGSSFALLASLFRLSAGPTRTVSFGLVAALAGPDGGHVVKDGIRVRDWVPRL